MLVQDYIKQRFSSFGINLSEADLLAIWQEETLVSKENISRIEVQMARFIPSLLLRPTSIGESGFSMSWDSNGIKEYYGLMCKKYGLVNELSSQPKVKFL